MPSNSDEFARYLRKLARELPEEVFLPAFRRVAFKILEGAVQNSPVNFGQLRNGWHVTVGSRSGADVQAGGSVAAVLEAGSAMINSAEFGSTVWIQNNVPYARVWEEGLFVPPDPGPSKATHVPKSRRARVAGTVLVKGGYNVAAPQGMLGDAIQTVIAEFDAGGFDA